MYTTEELAKIAGTNYFTARWYRTKLSALTPRGPVVRGAHGGARVFTEGQCFQLAMCLALASIANGEVITRARRMLQAVGKARYGWVFVGGEKAIHIGHSDLGLTLKQIPGLACALIDVESVYSEVCKRRRQVITLDREAC